MSERAVVYRFGDIKVDAHSARVYRSDRPISIEPKAFEVLRFLIDNPGRLVQKQELLDVVWTDTVVTENAMTRVVAHLRKSLGDQAKQARYIETVPTKGYRFIADVTTDNGAVAAPAARPRYAVPLLALVAGIAIGLGSANLRRTGDPPERASRQLVLPLNGPLLHPGWAPAFDLSPRGNQLVLVGHETGSPRTKLYVRDLTSGAVRSLAGTDGASTPAFSPDGLWIAFLREDRLMKVSADGRGHPQTVAQAAAPWPSRTRGFWLSMEELGLARFESNELLVEAFTQEGRRRTVAKIAVSTGQYHSWVEVLPDERGLLLSTKVGTNPNDVRIDFLEPNSGEQRTLVAGHHGRFLPTGHILYVANDTLLVAPFDPKRGKLAGPQETLVEGILSDQHIGVAQFAYSSERSIAYLPALPTKDVSLVWVDRSGEVTVAHSAPFKYAGPVISGDGKRVAFRDMTARETRALWLLELASGETRRLPIAGNPVSFVFHREGAGFVFAGDHEGEYNLYAVSQSGTREPERLTTSSNRQFPKSVSADGRLLVYEQENGIGRERDIWQLELDRGVPKDPKPLVASGADEREPSLSPDGRRVVYQSNASGRSEIYIYSVPTGRSFQVTTDGGRQPIFTRGGEEIVYRNGLLMLAVAISGEEDPDIGYPTPLFETNLIDPGHRNFDVTPDGLRFIGVRVDGLAPYDSVQLVLDWTTADR